MESLKEKKGGFRNNYFLKAFFLGLGLSFLVFIPFIVVDGGRFLFYGDFNVQQVPFTAWPMTPCALATWGGAT